MGEIKGYYLDGKTSKKHTACLTKPKDCSVVITGNHQFSPINLNFYQLTITSRLANTPREISWGDEQLFVTDNNDAVDALIKQIGSSKSTNKLHILESKLPLVFVSTLLAVALIAAFIIYGIPTTAKYVAQPAV